MAAQGQTRGNTCRRYLRTPPSGVECQCLQGCCWEMNSSNDHRPLPIEAVNSCPGALGLDQDVRMSLREAFANKLIDPHEAGARAR